MPTNALSNVVVNIPWTLSVGAMPLRMADEPLLSPGLRWLCEEKVILVSKSLVSPRGSHLAHHLWLSVGLDSTRPQLGQAYIRTRRCED